MSRNDKLQSLPGLPSLPPEMGNNADLASFIFSLLIDQNAELMQNIQELNSQKKLADEIVAEVQQEANVLILRAEKETNLRVANIISDAEEKARAEAARILAEATRQAEATCALKEEQANDRAASIIREAESWAKIEADKILAEAKRKAEQVMEEKTQSAIQEGLLIINKAQEQAFSILDDVHKQAEAITSKAKRSRE